MDKEITFEKLPEAVTYLTEQVSAIKEMVSALHPPVPEEKISHRHRRSVRNYSES
ncbi:mobilizable transposon%252C Xis protein [Porphyromonas gingivalis]|nr:mobilizable transposon%252C Xis protein [Porphyromonas gingivalis]